MSVNSRVAGVWKTAASMHVNVGGPWKTAAQVYVRVAGVWKEVLTAAKVLTYQVATGITATTTTYLFEDLAAGTAAADRRLIFGITAQGPSARSFVSVTVKDPAGVWADIIAVQIGALSANTRTTGIYIALVPVGALVDVEVVWSNTEAECQIGVWSCTGLPTNAANDTKTSTVSPAVAANLATLEGGFAIAVWGSQNNTTAEWTNATERFDQLTANRMFTGADATTAAGLLTITATSAGATGSSRAMIAASF